MSRPCRATGIVFCRRCNKDIDVVHCKKGIVRSGGRVFRLEFWRVWADGHVWLDTPQAASGNLNFGLFFSRFRQGWSWIDDIFAVVRMLLFECVFGLCWKILFTFQDIRQFFDDKFDLFPVKPGTDPDHKTRDLIHGVSLLKEQDNRFWGGEASPMIRTLCKSRR